jgi:TrmH family RNA methyltransferase
MSISKAQIKNIRSLHQSKFRRESGLFIIEGEKLIQEAMDAGAILDALYSTDEAWCKKNAAEIILDHEMQQISALNSPSPFLAITHQLTFKPISSSEKVLYLDGIKDPGNLGTLIRSADAFGWSQIVMAPQCVEIYNPKVVQSTMGSIFHVQIQEDSEGHFLEEANMMKRCIVGADLKGQPLKEMPMPEKGPILVIGSESHGISTRARGFISNYVRIEQSGRAESLNAAIAASILMHHWSV